MQNYLALLEDVLTTGVDIPDRTGVGCRAAVGKQIQLDLANGFPLLTTKKVSFKNILHELLWMVSGDTNTDYLHEHGVTIWDEWANAKGDLGPIYGKQWRSWPTTDGRIVDQLSQAVKDLINNQHSRRIVINSWNVSELQDMALPPCHLLYQFHVLGEKVHITVYQRSADLFLGLPYNIASYATLLMMVASVCGYTPGTVTIFIGNAHIYSNHFDQVVKQKFRKPYPLPTLQLNPDIKNIFAFIEEDFTLSNYMHWPAIPADVAV